MLEQFVLPSPSVGILRKLAWVTWIEMIIRFARREGSNRKDGRMLRVGYLENVQRKPECILLYTVAGNVDHRRNCDEGAQIKGVVRSSCNQGRRPRIPYDWAKYVYSLAMKYLCHLPKLPVTRGKRWLTRRTCRSASMSCWRTQVRNNLGNHILWSSYLREHLRMLSLPG